MRDEDIERTTIVDPVQQQAGQHAECSQIRIRLRMLVCPIRAVPDRTAEAADQKLLKPYQLQIHVGTAVHARQGVIRVVVGIMVARHIE